MRHVLKDRSHMRHATLLYTLVLSCETQIISVFLLLDAHTSPQFDLHTAHFYIIRLRFHHAVDFTAPLCFPL